ncbi:Protein kinase-like domain superfamily, partial [Arabidopsis suecica]
LIYISKILVISNICIADSVAKIGLTSAKDVTSVLEVKGRAFNLSARDIVWSNHEVYHPAILHMRNMSLLFQGKLTPMPLSLHQGPKIDVWSAGVTLLYLMMGTTPFTADPEQLRSALTEFTPSHC